MMKVEQYLRRQTEDPSLDAAERTVIQDLLSQARKWNNEVNMVREFSPGTLKDIERNHGVVFNPLEASLAKLVAAERPFWHITNRDNPDFMNLVSRPTQIVIFPQPTDFYVPESNNKSLDQQRELLAVDEAEVVKRRWGIGGLRLSIGDVATHTGFVFAYFDKTNHQVRLHGGDYGYRYGRTETVVGSGVASVGLFNGVVGLGVGGWRAGRGFPDVWAVRLGVPAKE